MARRIIRPHFFVMTMFATACLAACAAAQAAPADEIRIPGSGIYPESLTSTSDGSVYIGSIGKGVIFRAKPGADSVETFVAAGTDGLRQVFGVYADEKHGTLWACSNQLGTPPGQTPPPSALHAFDLRTGAAKGRYEFPKGGMCNDIAVAADGTAYATDTPGMQVLRLKKGGKGLEPWAGNGAFGPAGGVLDGITLVGARVIVNTLATSKLFAIDVAKDGSAGAITELKLTRQVQRPDGMRALGKDSLLSTDGTGKVVRITLLDTVGTVRVVKEGFDGIVGVTPVGAKDAYALEGQLGALMRAPDSPPPPPEKPYKATRITLE
jgi:sugar lactone lactonase YvrE